MSNKRDIFRFVGGKETAVNLHHVSLIEILERKITVTFYTHSIFVEFDTEEVAKDVYEQIMKLWVSDVLE